ncbi:MAG: AmmeMemoRadiSam system protein B [Candidatus Nanoarchaeia archaeon]|nr:AmmeMemoRadiSam system protein B [Candidatus Nanoarchaeia archaeon]MDD5741235.1 AmmeMemoRadiSam system protein B [Candidatus Nanoarchaeia archaeon]
MGTWYPEHKQELDSVLTKYLKSNIKINKKINGLIVPHAGYEYSGAVAGKAFSLLKNKRIKKAIIIGPSHYNYLNDAITSNREYWETPLNKTKIFNKGFLHADIYHEHSIKNQLPFLQKLNFQEIMPLMVGEINLEKANEIAKKISKIPAVYIFSTDLSHFFSYDEAVKKDKNTIHIIESLDFNRIKEIDACGIYPLLILFCLCKIKKTKPHLIVYKNSGDVTGDKEAVVGYGSFYF